MIGAASPVQKVLALFVQIAPRLIVNALYRANPISTVEVLVNALQKEVCQCPSSGESHFYGYEKKQNGAGEHRVNALHRANPISTSGKKRPMSSARSVSMPFIGRIPFLLDNSKAFETITDLCQCPSSGESHFY